MRICIDARSLRDQMTGLGRYAANLVRHLALLDPENEYLILRRPSRREVLVEQGNFTEIVLPGDISSARNLATGALAINPLKADIYHSLFHFLPFGVRARRLVVTLHDLIWVNHRQLADPRPWRRWVKGSLGNWGIRRALAAADQIIAISESTRQAALSSLAIPPAKITTIHHGVASGFAPAVPAALPAACQGRAFVFSLGNSLPYKNLPRLLRAFGAIAPRYPGISLVIAGRGESYPALARLSHQLGLAERVRFAGALSDGEVHRCLSQALFFAFPSLVEGFGLPVLEAMASGCPVLTANTSSTAEVAGQDAVLVDPGSADAIAEGMKCLLDNALLRQRLSSRGRQRAARFTWQRCAEQTLALYRSELTHPHPGVTS